MAYIKEIFCNHCHQTKREVDRGDGVCAECRVIIDKADKDAYLAKLSALSTEERLRRIESELYSLKIDERLKHIEILHTRF